MTRRSEREIERGLDALTGNGDGVRSWLADYLEAAAFEVGFAGSPPAGEELLDGVRALRTEDATISVPAADGPDWIDVDEDLPVRG